LRGSDALMTMRKAGKRPVGVWISHRPSPFCNTWQKYDDMHAWPEIEILQSENPENLDLRFVVGLIVHVSGCFDYKVAKKLHEALLKASAKRVITTVGKVIIDSETGETDDYVPE